MKQERVRRSALYLFAVATLALAAAAVAFSTDQPDGVWSLLLGIGMGINVATALLVAEVGKSSASES